MTSKLVFTVMLSLTIATVFSPLVVSAASTGLVPCGDQTYSSSNPSPQGESVGDISNPCDFNALLTLVTNITNFLIIVGASIAALAFAYAGFLMMTAGGETGKIEEAKAIFGKVLTGFIIMLSAWLIVYAIEAGLLNTTNGTPEQKFNSFLQKTT